MSEKAVWSVAQAKARLSEVIARAVRQGPQAITKNGRPAVVVVSFEEWARKTGRKGVSWSASCRWMGRSPMFVAAYWRELATPAADSARWIL